MLSIENISKSYGGQNLFDDVSFKINPREKVGLVGRNGHGKTTMMRIITGQETADSGMVNIPRNYTIGYLKQNIDFTKDTVLEEAATGLKEEFKDDVWKAEKILNGLGFVKEDMNRHPKEFSGGYQVRIKLAKVLVNEPDMLMLDEPTNYLDITSIRWLEDFLIKWKGELLLITHDRNFMDKLVTHTVGIHRKNVRKIEGGTEKLYEQLAKEEEIHEKTRLNDEQKRKDMELFISRFRAKARLAGMVQSRIKTLNKMEKKNRLEDVKDLDFKFRCSPYSGKEILKLNNVSFGYEKENSLIDNLNLTIGSKDRICIIGKNGRGKTTLLKLMANIINPDQGSVYINNNAKLGVYEQTNIKSLVESNTVENEILHSHVDVERQLARDIAGTMMFEGESALKKIGVLSGGEKSRVMLGKILAKPVNLLMLDEPTNHLDMQSCDALLAALDNFDGAMVIVTHNEMFLHALATRLVVFQKGRPYIFEGTYQEFLDKEGWAEEDDDKKRGTADKVTKKDLRKLRSEIISERSKVIKPLQQKVDNLETLIDELDGKLAEANDRLIKASETGDADKITEYSKTVHELTELVDEKFAELETATDELDDQSAYYEQRMSELEQN